MGNTDHTRAQRAEVKEKIRGLRQEIDQFSVCHFLFHLPLSNTCPFWGRTLRMTRN